LISYTANQFLTDGFFSTASFRLSARKSRMVSTSRLGVQIATASMLHLPRPEIQVHLDSRNRRFFYFLRSCRPRMAAPLNWHAQSGRGRTADTASKAFLYLFAVKCSDLAHALHTHLHIMRRDTKSIRRRNSLKAEIAATAPVSPSEHQCVNRLCTGTKLKSQGTQ